MPENSRDKQEQIRLRNKILGIGDTSIRKSYYPQLQNQIKKLKLAKERAEENERKFSEILNSTSDGIVLVDPKSKAIVLANHTAQRMFGYSAQEMEQLTFNDLAASGHQQPVMAGLLPEQENNSTNPDHGNQHPTSLKHLSMQSKDKRPMTCDIRSSFVEIEGMTFILALILDVTRLVTMEKEKEEIKAKLAHTGKMEALGTMAGGIAHDFNNILSAIFAYSQLAINHISDPERAKNDIQQIQKAGQKAADLTGQILSFSRRTSHNKIAMPIYNVVKEALELFSSTCPENIEIKDRILSSASIMADPTNIHQLMLNLCTNAFHAMAETGGVLTVALAERAITTPTPMFATLVPGNYLELTVSDTGHGMDAGTMERIFEPYFTTKKTGQGTGFGLALVHSIIKDHGGEIFVKSEPGRGTRFHLFFPVI